MIFINKFLLQVGGTKPQSVRSVLECLDTLLLAPFPVVSSFCLASSSSKTDGAGGASLLKAVANILGKFIPTCDVKSLRHVFLAFIICDFF